MEQLSKKEIERLHNTGVRKDSGLTRKEANRELLEVLEYLIEVYPNQRFGQLFCNYIFPDYREKDPFYEESAATLERLKEGKK